MIAYKDVVAAKKLSFSSEIMLKLRTEYEKTRTIKTPIARLKFDKS